MAEAQTDANAAPEPASGEPEKIQDFIFGRELSEIYLLLDHISGRSDKRLDDSSKAVDGKEPVTVEEICQIGWPWPPQGNGVNKASQAAKLIKAKDWLNAAARLQASLIGNSILPLLYGFMGAAAAVGRDLWTKVRESLLSPRDFTLACMQLMLGVTMGACMGLFFHPGSGDSQDAAARSVILTASAISFLAGFGVEGVFQMLESLVKRVFNVTEPGKK